MTLFAALVALILEQFRPMPAQRWVRGPLAGYAQFLEQRFNDGKFGHGVIAWSFAVALPALVLQVAYWVLLWRQPIAALVLGMITLYVTMGFRQFSHYFTDIQLALRVGAIGQARQQLAAWRGASGQMLSSSDVARLSIEEALLASHRHVFAPLFCFALIGPGGAMLYRLSLFFSGQWVHHPEAPPEPGAGRFGEFALRFHRALEWLPMRVTAMAFAVMGDFEDAIYCWRTQAASWLNADEGLLLAAGAGALGVRLGQPVRDTLDGEDRPELGLGDEADADYMQSTVGLVWRTLLLFLLAMGLVWIGGWVG